MSFHDGFHAWMRVGLLVYIYGLVEKHNRNTSSMFYEGLSFHLSPHSSRSN